jgi:hypothetical protein
MKPPERAMLHFDEGHKRIEIRVVLLQQSSLHRQDRWVN